MKRERPMDCQTTRQMIDMHPEGVSGWRSAEGEAVRDHLASCSLCQSAARDIGEWDQRVRAVMVTVDVAHGLRDRLLAQLANSSPQAVAQVTRPAPTKRSVRRWASVLSLCLAVVAGVSYWVNLPPKLLMATVNGLANQTLLQHPESKPAAFDKSFAATVLDPQWQSVCAATPVGVDLDHRAGHDAAAYRVNIPSLRFSGWLVMIPISRISDVPSSLDPTMVSNYSQVAAWHDEKFVYVCISEQGNLKTLVDQWAGRSA